MIRELTKKEIEHVNGGPSDKSSSAYYSILKTARPQEWKSSRG